MEVDKQCCKAVLVTLGAAFVLLSVIEWKKLADQIPSDDNTFAFSPAALPEGPNYSLVCKASGIAGKNADGSPSYPAGSTSLALCQAAVQNSNFPWTQIIKAFVYTWIGIGLLVAAFMKHKGSRVSGGANYW